MIAAYRASNTRKVALTGVVDGRHIPVGWACREDLWQVACNDER